MDNLVQAQKSKTPLPGTHQNIGEERIERLQRNTNITYEIYVCKKKLRQVIKMILPLWAIECVYQKHFSVLNLLSSASIWEAISEDIGQLSWIHMATASVRSRHWKAHVVDKKATNSVSRWHAVHK